MAAAGATVTPITESSDIELFKDEIGGLLYQEGICTITFFKGDFQTASKNLRQQLVAVIGANPWLAGRLVKVNNVIKLRYPNSPGDAEEIGQIFKSIPVNSTNDSSFKFTPKIKYDELCRNMYQSKKVVVGAGNTMIDKNIPVVLLTLAESSPNEFALIFSMSHVIADGHTYYNILNMLQPGIEVRSLNAIRIMSFSERMKDAYGRKELEWIDSVPASLLMMRSMKGNPTARIYAVYLDDDKITKAKEEGIKNTNVKYVTTNDILTSGFFNVCRTRIGVMGFDCRDKGLDDITSDLAGNYVTSLVMDPEVFGTPASLRQMYTPGVPYVTTKMPLPGCCCGNGRTAMVTSWSAFATGLISLEGCEMVIHLPVADSSQISWDQMIPFAAGNGKKGVICWTVSTDHAGLKEALPLGDSVSQDLFPF